MLQNLSSAAVVIGALRVKTVCYRKIIFLLLIQNICCGYAKEPSQDGSKHTLNIVGMKIFTILS